MAHSTAKRPDVNLRLDTLVKAPINVKPAEVTLWRPGPSDLSALSALGIATESYGDLTCERSQEIGDAAFFLGFDGIPAPSARWPCQNLILFPDRFEPGDLAITASEPVDWNQWRTQRKERRN